MGITGYTGRMKGGKTALAVYDMLPDYFAGLRTISNIDLKFPAVKGLRKPEHWHLIDLIRFMDKDSDWYDISMLWDEIYLTLEARVSGSQELNRIGSYFIFQSGKRKVRIRWTSQRFGSNDNRLRWATLEAGQLVNITDTYVVCPLVSTRIRSYFCTELKCPKLDICLNELDYYMKYQKLEGRKWKKYTLHKVQGLFKMYDAYEIVDYRETLEVQAYLSARRKTLRKQYTEQTSLEAVEDLHKLEKRFKV